MGCYKVIRNSLFDSKLQGSRFWQKLDLEQRFSFVSIAAFLVIAALVMVFSRPSYTKAFEPITPPTPPISPVTPPVTPPGIPPVTPPFPTSKPDGKPVILNKFLHPGVKSTKYRALVRARGESKLTMEVFGLPEGLEVGRCLTKVVGEKDTNLHCFIVGKPVNGGVYYPQVIVTSENGDQVKKNLRLVIFPKLIR
jgi:hypothetical protein